MIQPIARKINALETPVISAFNHCLTATGGRGDMVAIPDILSSQLSHKETMILAFRQRGRGSWCLCKALAET